MLIFQVFLQISEICFQKAIVQYITFKTAALYLRKIKHFLYTSTRNLGTHFSYFRHFLQKFIRNSPKNDGITSILIIVTLHFSIRPVKNNLLQLQLSSKIIFNDHSAVNSAKIKPRQHILAVPLVTSPGIIRSEDSRIKMS